MSKLKMYFKEMKKTIELFCIRSGKELLQFEPGVFSTNQVRVVPQLIQTGMPKNINVRKAYLLFN